MVKALLSSMLTEPQVTRVSHSNTWRLVVEVFFSLTGSNEGPVGIHLGRRPNMALEVFLAGRGHLSAAHTFWVQISGQRGAGLPKLGLWNHHLGARFQASQAETRQVLVAQAGAWAGVAGLLVTPKTFSWPGRRAPYYQNQCRRKKVRG